MGGGITLLVLFNNPLGYPHRAQRETGLVFVWQSLLSEAFLAQASNGSSSFLSLYIQKFILKLKKKKRDCVLLINNSCPLPLVLFEKPFSKNSVCCNLIESDSNISAQNKRLRVHRTATSLSCLFKNRLSSQAQC